MYFSLNSGGMMKNLFVLPVLFVIVFGFAAPAFSECSTALNALVCGKWESGSIDASVWQSVGAPPPTIENTGYNSNYSVDLNGDSWCQSGFFSKDAFSVQSCLIVEFAMKGSQTTFSSCMGIKGGLTLEDKVAGYYCNQNSEPPGLYQYLAYIHLDPRSGEEKVRYIVGDDSFEEDYPDDDWHLYKIEILLDDTINFYRDGQLKYSTVIDRSELVTARFQSEGRSCHGTMLIDNILVSNCSSNCPTQTDLENEFQSGYSAGYAAGLAAAGGDVGDGNGSSEECGYVTYDFLTPTIHFPCLTIGSESYWLDLGVVGGSDPFTFKLNAAGEN